MEIASPYGGQHQRERTLPGDVGHGGGETAYDDAKPTVATPLKCIIEGLS